MTTTPFFQVDAFAERPFGGNPAAVMPLTHWLDDALMQAIAAENNLSETAFTVPSDRDDADYDLRWFTPTVEVDLCGHATLAAAHILLTGKMVRFSTKSGILTVTREGELLQLDLPAAQLEPASTSPTFAEALGLSTADLFIGPPGNGNAIVLLSNRRRRSAPSRPISPRSTTIRQLASSPLRATTTPSPAGSSLPTAASTRIR